MINQILGWAPSGEGRWYKTYGQIILTCLLAGWAIAMTELELVLNDQTSINSQWGFGQVYTADSTLQRSLVLSLFRG